MKKFWFTVVLAASVASAASAQVSTINSAVTSTQVRSDPTSTLTVTNNYPSAITISDQNVHTQLPGNNTYSPNKTDWFFSNNGTSAYQFDNNDFFTTSMTLTLTGTGTDSTRKEAGFLLNTPTDGQGQFILDTDQHEVVAFGGPLPFYQFKGTGTPAFAGFNSGDSVTLGINYFLDSSGMRAIIYTADDLTQNTGVLTSPAQELSNLEQGIITGSTLGGYEQTTAVTGQTNGITAVFSNISIAPAPEPSGFVAILAGALPLGALVLLRRRRTAG